MSRRFGSWQVVLAALVLAGYPAVAALAGLAGLGESNVQSIAFRFAVAALGVGLFLAGRRHDTLGQRLFLLAFGAFWAMYITRILVDAFVLGRVSMPWSGVEYLAYSIVFSILPALGASVPVERVDEPRAVRRVLAFALVALLLVAVDAARLLGQLGSPDGVRLGLEKLNPIALAQLAGSAVILAVYLRSEFGRSLSWRWRVLLAPALVLAVALMAYTGSKGPMVGVLAVLTIHYLVPLRSGRALRFTLAVLAGVALLVALAPVLQDELNVSAIWRFADLLSGRNEDESTSMRLEAYTAALDQFVGSPLFGDALVEDAFHYYPHNLLLEAAMATGVPGLACMLLLVGLSAVSSLHTIAVRGEHRWLHLLNLQHIVAAQFSGGIHASAGFWFFVVAAVFATAARGAVRLPLAGAAGTPDDGRARGRSA